MICLRLGSALGDRLSQYEAFGRVGEVRRKPTFRVGGQENTLPPRSRAGQRLYQGWRRRPVPAALAKQGKPFAS
jgi:hypothetical protein